MADGIFRSKQGYTVVQNIISRDKTISMKAKGLYLIIQSYITMPDAKWLKSSFMKMVPEGDKAFNSAWNELKEKGYLKCHIYSDGKKFNNEYELLDEPIMGPHTFYYNVKGEMTKSLGGEGEEPSEPKTDSKKLLESQESRRYSQNGYVGNGHVGNGYVGEGHVGNGDDGFGHVGNGDVNNKSLEDKPLSINNKYINPSFPSDTDIREKEDPVNTAVPEVKERRMVYTEINLNLDEKVSEDKLEYYMSKIEESNGIPYEFADDSEAMTNAIQCLSEWNYFEKVGVDEEFYKEAFRLTIENLGLSS